MKLPVVILAGGLGKRLGKLTKDTPKALINIAGKPFISYQLDYLKQEGFKNITICSSYLSDKIKKYVGDGSKFNLNVSYSEDGPKLLGTGGSVKKATKLLDSSFFVLFGDTFLPINYATVEKAFFNQNKPALMTILKNNNQWDKSNAHFENNLVNYNKKEPKNYMKYIDYGLSVVNNSIFNEFPDNKHFDISDVFQKLSEQKLLSGYEVKERFYEIGSMKGLKETMEFLAK
jgi:NDP-sugar pyrophosphorylase family protein